MTARLSTMTAVRAILLLVGAIALATPPAMAAIVFDGSPGTGAPPATLGPYTMTAFPDDTRAQYSNVTTVASPLGGNLTFSSSVSLRTVGSGWMTWSHGYTGDVYFRNAESVTLTLPVGTGAFYFYVEPDYGTHTFTAVAQDSTTSGSISIGWEGGAKYFGFYGTAGDSIQSIVITAASGTDSFAVGEFGIAAVPTDLSVGKTASAAEVTAGEDLFYEITLTNNDESEAANVEVTDTLPLGVQYLADTGDCTLSVGTGAGGADEVVWNVDSLDALSNVSCEIKAFVSPDYVADTAAGAAVMTNTVEITNKPNDEDLTDDIATLDTFVVDSADLTIAKMSKPDEHVIAGEEFKYFIIVDNLGPSYARGVYINDSMLTSGWFTLLDVASDRDFTYMLTYTETPQNGQIILCELLEPLEPLGDSLEGGRGRWIMELTFVANQTQDINNIARVYTGPNDHESLTVAWETGTPDPDTSNNQAIDFVSIIDTSDLELVKTADPETLSAGEELTYTLTVTNNGPSTATDVVIEDKLPAGVEVLEVTAAGPRPGEEVVTVGTPGDPLDPTTCYLGALVSGESGTMTARVRVNPNIAVDPLTGETVIYNDAWAHCSNFDTDIVNDRASVGVTVTASADLAVTKTVLTDPLGPGESTIFRIGFVNNGPALAKLALLVDTLPDELEPLNAYIVFGEFPGAKGAGDCLILGNDVICELGDLPRGAQGTVFIVARALDDVDDAVVTNTVVINSETPDPNEANNTATADVTLVACALPAAPTNVLATNGIHIQSVMVTWDEVANADEYEIYRNTLQDFATAQRIATTIETEYVDYKPAPAYVASPGCAMPDPTVFYYWVVAVNDCGPSDPSEPDEGYENSLKSAGSLPTPGGLIELALLAAALLVAKAALGSRRASRAS